MLQILSRLIWLLGKTNPKLFWKRRISSIGVKSRQGKSEPEKLRKLAMYR